MTYVNVVIDNKSRSVDRMYTYDTDLDLRVGDIVQVPFAKGKNTKTGYVCQINVTPNPEIKTYRHVTSVDSNISLTEEMIHTSEWMRSRYGIRYIDAIHCFVPSGKPAKEGKEKEPYKDESGAGQAISALTAEQSACTEKIFSSMEAEKNDIFLIHGVTSSGKTEVYMQAVSKALEMGKTAIMLVPEIALTEQVVERFIKRFGKSEIAVLHSKLTKRERFDEWLRLRRGEAHICIGARAGIFAPLSNIGVIILDEEHESTYKSDQTPKYDTVDVAAKRLMEHRGVLLLGSATPSVVSYQRALEGTYKLLELKNRYNATPLPDIHIVDMKEDRKWGNRSLFSYKLQEAMRKTLEQSEQVILFQNRRGYHTIASCEQCGEVLKCPDCGISLVYHKREQAMVCHYCGRHFEKRKTCPECGGELRFLGVGTEQVEETVETLFPEYPAERLDLDTATNKREINRILKSFSKGKTKVLIGTQLVAKGLDFKNVGLVGVISADASLNIPDYRSSERSFQLVTQVAGRAGRGEKQGTVIVQSMQPEHFALLAAQKHSYESFFQREIAIREFMNYPPFSDLIAVEFIAEREADALEIARDCRNFLMDRKLPNADKIYEPKLSQAPASKDVYRYVILIKCPKGARNTYISHLKYYGDKLYQVNQKLSMVVDVNPYSSL